jgi:membrane associated rhomboid family serine protease
MFVKYLFLPVFLLFFLFADLSVGYVRDAGMYTRITYMFQHAGVIHLLINAISFISLFRALERRYAPLYLSAIIMVAGFLATFALSYEQPVVGASGMIYAMAGIYATEVWRTFRSASGKRPALTWIACMFICLAVSFFLPRSAFALHLCAFLLGLFIGAGRITAEWFTRKFVIKSGELKVES